MIYHTAYLRQYFSWFLCRINRELREDKVFYPAKAWIERSKMLVKSDKVPHPVAVRYGFENYVEGDVYCDGLPLGSFRSDNW